MGELKYSEGQAGRRIAAMRLLKDLPADAAARIETKITTGALSLSNVQQARSFFRDQSAAEPRRVITAAEKLNVLELVGPSTWVVRTHIMNAAISIHERYNMRTQHAPDGSNTMIQLHLTIYIAVRERQLIFKRVKNTTRSTVMD